MRFPPPSPVNGNVGGLAKNQAESSEAQASSGSSSEPPTTNARGTLVGTTGVGGSLQTDKAQCAFDDESFSVARSSVSRDGASLDDLEQNRNLSMESAASARSSLSGSRESGADRASMVGVRKKSVSFSEVKSTMILPKLDPTELQPLPAGELEGASNLSAEKGKWASEEKGFARMRTFSWSMRRWRDILQPEGGKANKSGVKRMAVLAKRVYESPPVKRAMEIFTEARCLSESKARNPLSDVTLHQGMLFSRSDLKALDAARMMLVRIFGDTATQFKDLAWRSSVVQRTTSMDKLDGKAIPFNGVFLPLTVTESPSLDGLTFPLSWSFSLDGDETSATRSQLSVLFWAEFLAGMRGSGGEQSQGFEMPLVNGKLQVVVINDSGLP